MPKKTVKKPLTSIYILIAVLLVITAVTMLAYKEVQAPTMIPNKQTEISNPKMIPFNFGSQKITLDKQVFTFRNGSYSDTSSGDNATIGERIVSSEGTKAVALLMDNPGGSGSFYYLVGASLVNGSETYSKPVLLGDRIKYETMTIDENGLITVNYLDRKKNEPMSAEPTQKMSMKFAFQDDGNLISVLH